MMNSTDKENLLDINNSFPVVIHLKTQLYKIRNVLLLGYNISWLLRCVKMEQNKNLILGWTYNEVSHKKSIANLVYGGAEPSMYAKDLVFNHSTHRQPIKNLDKK